MTDGEENASHEFRRDQIKQLVEKREREDRWVFSFLGANVDAFAEAGSLGMSAAAASPYVADSDGVKFLFCDLNEAASEYRRGHDYKPQSSDPRVKRKKP
jgi:hypothetical protein